MSQSSAYILRCPACKARNRVPADRVGSVAKCGKCSTPIPTEPLKIDYPLMVTDANFQTQIIQSPLPALLDCWAPWCGPCQMMDRFMGELASEWQGRIRIGKLNVDDNPRTSSQFLIRSIPTLLIFDSGQLKETLTGALPKQSIKQAMSSYL